MQPPSKRTRRSRSNRSRRRPARRPAPRPRPARSRPRRGPGRQPPPPGLRRLLAEPIHVSGVTYQQKWVKRPSGFRGPYWYAYYKVPVRVPGGGKTRSKYIGPELPASILEAFREEHGATPATPPKQLERQLERVKVRAVGVIAALKRAGDDQAARRFAGLVDEFARGMREAAAPSSRRRRRESATRSSQTPVRSR